MKTNIYLSGHLRDDWREKVKNSCKGYSVNFLEPKRGKGVLRPDYYTTRDILFINQADIVFAYLQKTDKYNDLKYFGLGVEVGYAKGLNKVIFVVNELHNDDNTFLFIEPLASAVSESLEEGIDMLKYCIN